MISVAVVPAIAKVMIIRVMIIRIARVMPRRRIDDPPSPASLSARRTERNIGFASNSRRLLKLTTVDANIILIGTHRRHGTTPSRFRVGPVHALPGLVFFQCFLHCNRQLVPVFIA